MDWKRYFGMETPVPGNYYLVRYEYHCGVFYFEAMYDPRGPEDKQPWVKAHDNYGLGDHTDCTHFAVLPIPEGCER